MEIKIRKTVSEDRQAIKTMLVDTNIFNQEEIDCALELIDTYLNNPSQKDYLIVSAINEDNEIAGYACYGKAPLTNGTYDLYWIAVKPEYQRHGIGKTLLNHVEEEIERLSGRLLLAETSSRAVYEKTRQFYINNCFSEEARVKDFYSRGDDKIIYRKEILQK
jgi:ribosomal protein S18 acetylase RimI-like enzyme